VSVGLYYVHFDNIFENVSDYDTAYRIFSKSMQKATQNMLGNE